MFDAYVPFSDEQLFGIYKTLAFYLQRQKKNETCE